MSVKDSSVYCIYKKEKANAKAQKECVFHWLANDFQDLGHIIRHDTDEKSWL